MKKVLSLVLIVIMCLFTLTSCDMSDVKTWIGTNMPWVGTIIPGLTPDQPDDPIEPSKPATVADNARDYLESIYISFLDNNKTPADFELISSFKFNGSTATVAWTTNNESITFVPKEGKEDTVVIATLPARGEADVEYVLTGTVTAPDGSTATLSYTLVIPQMAINTYAEYVAAAKDDLITVEGIVTGITKKSDGWSANNLFLQDADGGYYVYNLADDQLNGVEVGMKVRVSGSKDNYNGTYEVVSASVSIVDSNKAPVSPADYTELLKNAEGLEAEALVSKQAFLVTIKGVTILEAGENGYYYFQLGEHKVYLRISSSNNPCTSADVDAIKAAHAANFGNTGDVTGLVSIYSNKFYLTPVSGEAFNNFTVVEKTDAEKVAYEKENLSIKTSFNNAGEYTLPLVGGNYTDVAVSWVSGSELIVIGENGAITVTLPEEKTDVTLTATFKLGDVTETKEYTVSVAAKSKVAFNIVDTPVVGNEYYFMVEQGNLDNKKLFALGEMSGNYMKTVEDYTTALKVKVLEAEGGYYLQIGEKYIGVSSYDNNGKTSYKITLDDTATTVFVWNTEHKTFTTKIEDVDLYLGTYSTYETLSASKLSYISTSFPAHLVTVGTATVVADGDYTISAGDIHLAALEESKTYGYLPKADVGTAFTIKNVDGGVTIQDSFGRYLYMSGTYNTFQLGKTAPEDGSHVWKVTDNGDGTYTFVNSVTEKIIGYSSSYSSAGAYAEAGTNVVALTLAAYVAPSEPEIPTEEGKVTVYFTLKDSITLNSFNRYYFTGTLTGWKSGKEAPVFTNLEGTDIWYMIVDVTIDKTVDQWNNYKLIIGTENDGLKWQRSWTTTSAPNYGENNCEFEYNEGDQLVNLGEHTFVGQPAAETFTGWSVIGHFENLADVYHEWRGDFDLVPTDEVNILESDWITINAKNDNFKVRKDFGWNPSYGSDTGKDGNFWFEKDGTYKIRFNTETHEITVVEKPTTTDPDPDTPVTDSVVFDDFGGTFDNKHSDGATENGKTPKDGDTLTSGDATLVINNPSKMYLQAFNESGDSCIKMGAGSAAGTFSFTVGSDVKSVKIYISGYKKTDAKVKVNDTEYTAKALYNDYDTSVEVNDWTVIVVDTSTNKTVTITTLTGGYRCMIDKIELVK